MPADPFEVLREPIVPLAAPPAFAAELRRRLIAQLGVSDTDDHTREIREYTPSRLRSMTPYLSCKQAERAISWYIDIFGAALLEDPVVMPDGRVGHAELRVGDTVFMLADEFEDEDFRSPETLGGHSVALMIFVPDSETTYNQALAAGARSLRPIAESYGSRGATIVDPFGHRWFVNTHIEADDVPIEDRDGRRLGDIGYMTLEVADGDRARRFYGELFGWKFAGGHEPGSYHVSSITPPSGIHQRPGEAEIKLYFRVDDIDAMVARVRELGGEVLSVASYDSGGNAECIDDQGVHFSLFRPRAGY